MDFDLRKGNYAFKHSRTFETPDTIKESFQEHFHSVYELLYFLDGNADYSIRNTRYTLRPHNLLVVKPGELHRVIIKKGKRPYERFVIRFDEADLPRGWRTRIRSLSSVYYIKGTELSKEILRMDVHQNLPDEESRFHAMRWELNLILTYLCSAQGMRQQADEINEDVLAVIECVERDLPDIHTMDDLCTRLHMSRSNLQRIFSSQFSTPIMSYVRTQKVTMAHALLTDGFPPMEVPERCGFRNYSTFYRAYMQTYHVPPSAVSK